MSIGEFRNAPQSWHEVRQSLQRLYGNITKLLGSISKQDADDVTITGGDISGTDIDVSENTLTLADDQIDVEYIGTTETATNISLVPDGAGGVTWAPTNDAGADGNNWNTFLALIGAGGI